MAVLVLVSCKSREERLQAAEDKGDLLVSEKARLVKGIGNGLDTEGSAASESLLKGAAKVIKSAGKGAVEGWTEVPLALDGTLTSKGMKVERIGLLTASNQVKAYLITEKAMEADLTMFLRDKEGRESGRSKLHFKEEDAVGKYVLFNFDPLTDWTLVASAELK